MKKVVTTDRSQVLGVVIKELGKVVPAGVIFECTDNRFAILSGKNGYHAIFVRDAELKETELNNELKEAEEAGKELTEEMLNAVAEEFVAEESLEEGPIAEEVQEINVEAEPTEILVSEDKPKKKKKN